MKKIKFLDLAFDRRVTGGLERAARRVIRSGTYLYGSEVKQFERDFTQKYFPDFDGVAVGNGFDALRISMQALGIGSGSKVVVPTLSPLPVWMAVTAVGAEIIPADPPASRCVLTATTLPQVPYADAIIVVHLYGYPADVNAIREKAREMYGKFPIIIEDCCQAHGSRMLPHSYCGSQGNAAAFSFYPTKNLGGLGDSGLIITHDPVTASQCREIANYGWGTAKGVNSRMDEIQAAFLSVKLPYLDKWNETRLLNAGHYLHRLRKLQFVSLPEGHPGHSWHQFVINVKGRDALQEHLKENGIETAVHYYSFAPDMKYYNSQSTSTTIYMRNTALSLPIGPHVSISDVDYICDVIEKFASTMGKRNEI